MKYAKGKVILVIFFVFSYLIFPQKAYAYLDLGSGSFIFQLFMGALMGMLFAIKIHWIKIKAALFNFFFKKTKNKKR